MPAAGSGEEASTCQLALVKKVAHDLTIFTSDLFARLPAADNTRRRREEMFLTAQGCGHGLVQMAMVYEQLPQRSYFEQFTLLSEKSVHEDFPGAFKKKNAKTETESKNLLDLV